MNYVLSFGLFSLTLIENKPTLSSNDEHDKYSNLYVSPVLLKYRFTGLCDNKYNINSLYFAKESHKNDIVYDISFTFAIELRTDKPSTSSKFSVIRSLIDGAVIRYLFTLSYNGSNVHFVDISNPSIVIIISK